MPLNSAIDGFLLSKSFIFASNSTPSSLDFSEHQKKKVLSSGVVTWKDRPELSVGIPSTTTAEHWDVLERVNNLSVLPSSPMNERRRSELGSRTSVKLPLGTSKVEMLPYKCVIKKITKRRNQKKKLHNEIVMQSLQSPKP